MSKILDGVTFKKNKKKLKHADHTPEYLAYHKDEPGRLIVGIVDLLWMWKMNNLWFTSDSHFGHANIIKLANRPFSSVEEMDETMIERWNEKIGKHDHVYHLGDFAVKQTREETERVLDRLNGHIHLIEGNHEDNALRVRHRFVAVNDYQNLKIGEQKIILFHYPIRSWDGIFKGSWHLYGHVHGLLPSRGKSLEVGVDLHNFYPLSFEEVKERMDKAPLVTEEEGFPNYIPLPERFK